MNKVLKFIALIFFCSIFSAYAQNSTSTNNYITIGALYNLTGLQSAYDKASLQGAELAIKEVNAAGGVLGKQLQLKILDGKSNPKIVAKNAQELATSKDVADFIIGLSDTDLAIAAIPNIAANQKILITTGATSPKLSALAPKSVIYTCFVDYDQATSAAEFAYEKLNAKNAIIITQSDMEYSLLLSKYFQSCFDRIGGNIIANGSFSQDSTNITASLKLWKTLKNQPDIFFVAAGEPDAAIKISQQIRQAGFQQPILGGDGFDIAAFTTPQQKKLKDIYFTTHAFITDNNPNIVVKNFIAAFRKNFNEQPDTSFSGLGYDTIKLLALAIQNAGTTDLNQVHAAFLNIKNYNGVTGIFSYYDPNPIPAKTVSIVKIHNGTKSFVEEHLPKNRI